MILENENKDAGIPVKYLNPQAQIQIDMDNTAEAYLKRGITKKAFMEFVSQVVVMLRKCMEHGLHADFDLKQMEVQNEHILFKVYVGDSGLSMPQIKEYLKTLAYTAVFQGNDFLQTVYEYLSYMDQVQVVTLEQISDKLHGWLTGEAMEISEAAAVCPKPQAEPQYHEKPQQEPANRYEGQYSSNGETGVLDPAFWNSFMTQETNDDPSRVRRQNNSRGASLVYIKTGEKIMLNKPEFIIGKSSEADYVINDSSISRKHAQITNRNSRYYVTDNGSTNGTYVNGRIIPQKTPIEIVQGDLLRFAAEEMKFQVVS